ncbi:MAG: LptA/OstA family protein [Pseudomonadota bacterium]
MSLRKTLFLTGSTVMLALALALPPQIPATATEQETSDESSSLFSGFGGNSDEPYEILADQLEVFDAEKYAILQGNVSVRQGASLLKSPYLKVFYTNSGGGASEAQGIRRIEARNGVYVESGTQVATGDNADYDAETEEMIMTGNVVLTDDGNVIKGDKLWVNLRTGESRVTADKRIQLILKPNSGQATE